MLMEDAMAHTEKTDDGRDTLYVLVISLLATLISLPAVWYAASSGFVA
jgi:hypothetical protein